jgi:putative tricarboxylic transport membrane protein
MSTKPGTTTGTTGATGDADGRLAWLRAHAEFVVVAFLVVLGILVITDTAAMSTAFTQRGPVGPKAVPFVVGGLLLVTAALLAVDVARGGRGEAEAGEDIDLDSPVGWRTVLLLAAAFLANIVLIEPLGFPISGMVLFWGSAFALGSRHHVRDGVISLALSVLTYLLFERVLGVPLPSGPLAGVL